jgi:ribosomal protein S19
MENSKVSRKLPFCTRYTYKFLKLSRASRRPALVSFLFRQLDVAKTYGSGWVPKRWYERSGVILRWFKTHTLRIHRGKRWRRLRVCRWNVGYAWGHFARTSVLAVFKKRATSKKQKKNQQGPKVELCLNLKVQHIKDVRAGVKRRSVMRYDDPVSLAIQASAAA